MNRVARSAGHRPAIRAALFTERGVSSPREARRAAGLRRAPRGDMLVSGHFFASTMATPDTRSRNPVSGLLRRGLSRRRIVGPPGVGGVRNLARFRFGCGYGCGPCGLAACRVGHFAADNAEADPAYAA
uniref:hypothetical protein n=1 Tax=Komagataeibacter piraceti TaxID=3229897 RepID=UPI003B58D8C7